MTQKDVAETGMPEASECRRALVIAQMPVSLHDAHLQFICIGASHKHVHIIVGLDDHSIGRRGQFHRLVRHPAEVCHNDESVSLTVNGIADGLGSIMRNDKITDRSKADVVPHAAFQHT